MASTLRFALLAAVLALGTACRSAGVSESGVRLGDKTLEQFTRGETTEAWLIAVVGPTNSESWLEGPPRVHVLRYTTVEHTSGLFDFLTGGSTRTTATIYFIVQNGVISNFWADREVQHSLFGGSTESSSGAKESR